MYNHSHLAPTMAIHDNSRPLPPTAYFRYQAAIVYELRQRRVQLFLPGASRWISSKWRGEDIQIKTAFWQLAEIREAEDKGKTAEDKARIKRDRRRRGGIYSCRDVLLEGSTNPEAHQLADIISAWVVKIPSPSPQELEKQTIPVTLRRTRKKEKKHPHPPTSSWPGFPTNSVQELPPDRTSQQTGTTGVPATTDLSTVDSLPLRDSPITSSTSSHCPYGYAPDLTPARPSGRFQLFSAFLAFPNSPRPDRRQGWPCIR